MSNTMPDARTGHASPGWYADPSNATRLRWWNGVAWSEQIREAVVAPTHQPVPTMPPPGSVVTPTPNYDPAYATGTGFAYLPASQQRPGKPHNLPARLALLFGILSVLVSLVTLLHFTSILMSTAGIAAIVNGVIARRLLREGRATARIRPIIGIVLGSIGTLVLVLSLLDAFDGIIPRTVSAPPQVGAQVPQVPQLPQLPTILDVRPPTPSNGVGLESWRITAVKRVTSKASGCGALTEPLASVPVTVARTDRRIEQDFQSLAIQVIEKRLHTVADAKSHWPALAQDPTSRVVYLAKSCTILGVLPLGSSIRYVREPDGRQGAIAVYDTDSRVGVTYRSDSGAFGYL